MTQYDLLPKQKAFMELPEKYYPLDVSMYQGGFGSGKSWCGALKSYLLSRLYPGSVGLIGAKDYTMLQETTMISLFEHLDNFGYEKGKDYTYNEKKKKLKFKNKSIILFKDLEDFEKSKSLNLHWIGVEEASLLSEAAFKFMLSRIRAPIKWKGFRYQYFLWTNPEQSKGWIYKNFVENKRPNYRRVIAPTSENTFLPPHYVEELKNAYDEEYYKINVLGQDGDYTSGLIVKKFTSDNIKNLNYIDSLPLCLTCDFNVDPCCWVLAHTDEENVYFFDEIVQENTCTQYMINEFCNRFKDHKSEIIIYGDASGNNRNTESEYTNYTIIYNTLKEKFPNNKITFRLHTSNPPILSRIQSYNARVCDAQGNRHIFVDKRCKWFLYNHYNLKFKSGTSEVELPTAHQLKTDRNAKFLEHPFDAGSYLVEYEHPIKPIKRKKNDIQMQTL